MMADVACSAPELVDGQGFNGGTLVTSGPMPDRQGRYPARMVVVDLGHEYATWVAVWPQDRRDPEWYCVWGHYFSASERDLAIEDCTARLLRSA